MSGHAFFDMPDEVIFELMDEHDGRPQEERYLGRKPKGVWLPCDCGGKRRPQFRTCYNCWQDVKRIRGHV